MKLLRILLVSLLAISSALEAKDFDPVEFSTGKFHGCPPTGKKSDPYLNALKNRDVPPKRSTRYTVPKLLSAAPTLPKQKKHRAGWSAPAKAAAAVWEARAVTVEGYLVHDAVKEGAEACNCGSTKDVDFHLWLAPVPDARKTARTRAMVIEVSPRMWPAHPTWNRAATFRKIIKDKSKVRVTGWLTWDQEHAAHLGKYRMTLWEVHPVHRIEVQSGNRWSNL